MKCETRRQGQMCGLALDWWVGREWKQRALGANLALSLTTKGGYILVVRMGLELICADV